MATGGRFTIGILQAACARDPRENTARAVAAIREAARRGAQVVCTQELFRSQYFCQTEDHANFDLAEPIPGPTTELLGRVAADLNIAIVASLFERRAAGGRGDLPAARAGLR